VRLRADVDFDALAGCISDGLAYLDADGRVAAWSAGAHAVTGIGAAQAVGKSLDGLFARIQPPLAFAALATPIELITNDERRRVLFASVLSIDDGWLISFGPEKRFAAIEQLRDEIVAAVSHELRTPIATIKAYATTLRVNPTALTDERDELLATIEEQADRLTHAVDDLLRVGHIDARHLLSRREQVSVDALLDLAQREFGAAARERVDRHATSVELSVDPELFADALRHLIDNALKFSPDAARVVVETRVRDTHVDVCVHDRGIGIAQEHLPYIFERFYRVERSLVATTGGNGLGLAIAREIVEAHGGSLFVESTSQHGSTFTISLAPAVHARSAQ